MLDINREFVEHWVKVHDDNFRWSGALQVEMEIREWLAKQAEPKYFDKEHFVKLGKWKTPRQEPNYMSNNESLIKEATRLAYETTHEGLKLHILRILEGVGVPVASTFLHFMHPDKFPIFDVHVRSSLKKAGKWNRSVDDQSADAWSEYIDIMRNLSKNLNVTLRELDKALWSYDKWGKGGKAPSLKSLPPPL